jgi:hypothetical protein
VFTRKVWMKFWGKGREDRLLTQTTCEVWEVIKCPDGFTPQHWVVWLFENERQTLFIQFVYILKIGITVLDPEHQDLATEWQELSGVYFG